jgi:hypothetical protein
VGFYSDVTLLWRTEIRDDLKCRPTCHQICGNTAGLHAKVINTFNTSEVSN